MTPEHTMTGAARLREALEEIKRDCGRVCPEFELCEHIVCQSSYAAWAIADEALAAVPAAPEPVYEWRAVEDAPGRWHSGPTGNRKAAEYMLRVPKTEGHIERRTAPGPWERVEEGTER